MRIDGTYTFVAPRDLVWSLLHDPAAIRQAIPGCEHYHLHADGKYHVSLNLSGGPFGGFYEGIVTRLEEQAQETISLSITGSGPEAILTGKGTLSLEESHGQTRLLYDGDVQISGQVPSQSPRLTRTTANFLIRSFLEGLDQQIHQVTGSAGNNGLSPVEAIPVERSTPTIRMQDFLAELRRDRWVAAAVFGLVLLAMLSLLGVVFLAILAVRWVTRAFTGHASQPADERRSNDLPEEET